MNADSTTTTVYHLPACDFCNKTARYDGKTIHGPWANMCPDCFSVHGLGLGTGLGQQLILAKQPEGGDLV
jgi:glutaredoxin